MVIICIATMCVYSDSRLALTTVDSFHDWVGLRAVYENATQYLPRDNLPSLNLTKFDPWGSTLWQLEELLSRGLISQARFDNASALLLKPVPQNPSLLYRLLSKADCTAPDAIPGTTPVTRSPGCQCIADTYLGFVRETVNMSSNVTSEMRTKYGGQVLRCLDRRVTRRTSTCKSFCSVHPIGLALYSNSAIFLSCAAFTLYFVGAQLGVEKIWVLQLIICALGVGLSIPFLVLDWQGNILNVCGLCLVVLNLLHGASEDLDDVFHRRGHASNAHPAHPHPFIVCVIVNLHIVIPVFMMTVGVSGYARDFYALSSFGVAGFLMGIALQVTPHTLLFSCYSADPAFLSGQCYLWDSWYGHEWTRETKMECHRILSGLFLAIFSWLCVAYVDSDGPFFAANTLFAIFLGFVILGIIVVIVVMHEKKLENIKATKYTNFGQLEEALCWLVMGGNVLLTIVTIIDSATD